MDFCINGNPGKQLDTFRVVFGPDLGQFMMKDFSEMQSAVEGLRDITGILHSYSLAEEEFLASPATRSDFHETVMPLYSKILEYQALVTQYFNLSTLKRLGRNMLAAKPWQGALEAVKKAGGLCHIPIDAMAVRLQQTNFRSLERLMQHSSELLKKSIVENSARRSLSQKVVEWISMINPFQDHAEIRRRLGDEYFGSGQWLVQREADFASWRQTCSGALLLQGVVGTGKSCLTSIVLEHLSTHTDGHLAFFYCSANASAVDPVNTVRNDASNIFRCVLAQSAILPDGSIAESVYEAFKRSHRQGPGESDFSLNTTLQMLSEILRTRTDQVTFIFDGLDELTDHGTFLRMLKSLHDPATKLRVFFSSRFGIDVSSEFRDLVSLPIGSHNNGDVQAYIENEVNTRYEGSGINQDQAERLKRALNSRSEGVYVTPCTH